jgi:hypothetical protein
VAVLDDLDLLAGGLVVSEELTDLDIISVRWGAGDRQIINRVIAEYDWDHATSEYTKRSGYIANASERKYGPREALRITSKGFHTSLGGSQEAVDARAFDVLKRYADPPPVIELEVLYRRHAWEVGDLISVTSSFIPNALTGAYGITDEIFEILNLRVLFAPAGRLVVTLLDVQAITPQAAPPTRVIADEDLGLARLAPHALGLMNPRPRNRPPMPPVSGRIF